MNCARSLSSQLGIWKIPSCMWPTRRMSLLKSPAIITFCVGWFLVRILIWSLIIGTSGRLVGCEGMYRFIMSSGVSNMATCTT